MKVSATAFTTLSAPGPGLKLVSREPSVIHPRDEIAEDAINGAEGATEQNAAVGLTRDGLHRAVRPGKAGKERGIQRAVRVQAGKAAFSRGAHGGEIAAGENLSAGLQREREDASVHAGGS